MLDRADHAADRGRVLERLLPAALAQAQAPQRRRLNGGTARGALDLAHGQHLLLGLGLVPRRRRLAALLAFAARDDLGDAAAAALGDHARALLVRETVEDRAHHVVRIGGAERLAHDVADAERLEHRAQRTAGDHAGAGRRRTHNHLARAVMAADFVMQRAAVLERHADQRLLGFLCRLADRLRNLARLAVAVADAAALVADDDESGEAEAASALHDLRDAIDVDELVDELVVALLAVAPVFPASAALAAATAFFTCHLRTPSRLRGRRQRAPSRAHDRCSRRDRTRPA